MNAVSYTDGRGNTTTGSCAAVIYMQHGVVIEKAHFLGDVTSNVAEYEGVILALRTALENKVENLKIKSDSQLIVNQVCGEYETKNRSLVLLRDRARIIASEFSSVEIMWVPREENTVADELCRKIARSVMK